MFKKNTRLVDLTFPHLVFTFEEYIYLCYDLDSKEKVSKNLLFNKNFQNKLTIEKAQKILRKNYVRSGVRLLKETFVKSGQYSILEKKYKNNLL